MAKFVTIKSDIKDEGFVSLKPLEKFDAQYNILYGGRNNGKTYAVLKKALENFGKNKKQLAILRRNEVDFKGKRARTVFDNVVGHGWVSAYTHGEFDFIDFYNGMWWPARMDDGKIIRCTTPIAYPFSISSGIHDKSSSYPNVTTILFDEFLTRGEYLTDEFVEFQNVCSTIIRNRDDVKIYMCGNVVNMWSPYYDEMGLTHVRSQKPGDIDVYTYGESGLKVAVYYSDSLPKTLQKSHAYFAFDNPKLKMITDGAWEMEEYPHNPCEWSKDDICESFHILFGEYKLRGDIISKDEEVFIFLHYCKYIDENLTIYTTEYSTKPNYRRNLLKPKTKLDSLVCNLLRYDRVFYSSNMVGEIMRNYLAWCKKA